MNGRILPIAAAMAMAGAGCVAGTVGGAPTASGGEAAAATITAEGLLADIRELASDRFLGRAVATAGEDSTVAYLDRRFREMGLVPGMPDGGYVQRVPLVATT